MIILLAGILWFLFNLDERAWRKKALSGISCIREFIHAVDVTQMYFTPDLYTKDSGLSPGGQRLDARYTFLCGRMIGILSNLVALYTSDETDESIWRAVSGVELLANAVATRLTNKTQVIPLISALTEQSAGEGIGSTNKSE